MPNNKTSAAPSVKVSAPLLEALGFGLEPSAFVAMSLNDRSCLAEQCYRRGRGKMNQGEKYAELDVRKFKCNQCVCEQASY